MPVTKDLVEELATQFDVEHDLIHIMDGNVVELELASFGYPQGKMKEDFFRSDLEDSESAMPHTNGTVHVEVHGARFVAHIRRISENNGLKLSEDYHLLALHISPSAFMHLDEDDSVLEPLTEALDGVICR